MKRDTAFWLKGGGVAFHVATLGVLYSACGQPAAEGRLSLPSFGGASASGGASGGGTAAPVGGSVSTGTGGSQITITSQPVAGQANMTCGADSHEAMQKPLAMYLLVDQSNSMTDMQDKWTPVASALKAFVSDPVSAGIKVAVGYFPFSSLDVTVKCTVSQYAAPDVAMGLLPDNSAAVVASLDAKVFPVGMRADERGSTPTRPAFEGAASYLTGWLQQNPDHVGVMVLATDGEPTQCTTNLAQDVVNAIGKVAMGTPPVQTFVIGIGSVGNLANFAQAGGTGHAPFIVDGTGANTQAEFLAAMQTIRGAALPCIYTLPTSANGRPDPNKVNVDYEAGSGAASVGLVRVADKNACTGSPNSWYYDNPSNPTSVVLCPDTCAQIGKDQKARVSIALGCDTRVR